MPHKTARPTTRLGFMEQGPQSIMRFFFTPPLRYVRLDIGRSMIGPGRRNPFFPQSGWHQPLLVLSCFRQASKADILELLQ